MPSVIHPGKTVYLIDLHSPMGWRWLNHNHTGTTRPQIRIEFLNCEPRPDADGGQESTVREAAEFLVQGLLPHEVRRVMGGSE